jgi:hypothetical protein
MPTRTVFDWLTGQVTSVELTQAELDALPVPIELTPEQQIAALETAHPITHRNLRDLSMTVAQIAGAVTGTDPTVNPAVQAILALEAQLAPLRAQLP